MAEQLNIEKLVAPQTTPTTTPEKAPQPEKFKEAPSTDAEVLRSPAPFKNPAPAPGGIAMSTNYRTLSQARAAEIDRILSAGLEDIFINLPPRDQEKFKATGEETVTKINLLLDGAKIKVKKIVELIRRWLATLPGVNRFFLEQEAKIKTDRILRLKK